MAVSHQGVFVQTPKITPASFVNADSTNKKTIHTAGSDGSKVVGIVITSTDTAARNVAIWLTRSGTSYLLGTINIPIGAGSDGTILGIDGLNRNMFPGLPFDNDGRQYLFLVSGDTLQASMLVAVTAAKEVDVVCIAGDF